MGNPTEAQSHQNPDNSANRLPSIDGSDVVIDLSSSATETRSSTETSVTDSQETTTQDETDTNNGAETEPGRNRTETADADNNNRVNRSEHRRFRLGTWPHRTSSLLACLCCVVGMYNISRFSLLVYIYKATFILQFLTLSIVFGIPFLYLQMALGQYMGTGILDMWYISPAFKGLGAAFLFTFFLIGVYTAVPISWLFIYFKDSFVNTRDNYRWTRCQPGFTNVYCTLAMNHSSGDYNGWSVPTYFHGRVLERRPNDFQFGELKFEVAFNLCIIWLLVFISNCRGPKSLGKVILVLGTLPAVLLLLVTMRMVEQWGEGILDLFPVSWKVSMTDSESWLTAAREVFLTWGIFGAAALHLCSHNKYNTNINRSVTILSFSAISILVVASLLFASVMSTLAQNGFMFLPTSYEHQETVRVFQQSGSRVYTLNVSAVNYMVGVSLVPAKQMKALSGYQAFRFATEVFPASLAIEGVQRISSFWSISFYAMLILFGLGQQIVVWSCVVESIITIKYKLLKTWQTTVTFITCNIAFLLGLPMSSNLGLYIMFFLDFCVGAMWWIIALYMSMMVAVLFVRGRKYGTDQLVAMLSQHTSARNWILPALTFQWNVVLPVSFLVLFITFLRSSEFEAKFPWTEPVENYEAWSGWVKKLAVWVQVTPLLILCVHCIYEGLLYLVPKSELTFSQRVQAWCCPVVEIEPPTDPEGESNSEESNHGIVNSAYIDDPPPKYTPPPSYSTATARMVVKQLMLSRTPSDAENTIRSVSICLQRRLDGQGVSHEPRIDQTESGPPT